MLALLTAFGWLLAPIAKHGTNNISGNIFFMLIELV